MRLATIEETRALGDRLGRALGPGDFIGLSGDLGAGKTTLVRAIAAAAGVAEGDVSSPTFAIVNSYAGRLPIAHVDLYRVKSRDELFATGYFDLLDADGAVIVEWVERIERAVPRDWLELRLRTAEGEARELEVIPHGRRAEALSAGLGGTAAPHLRSR